MFYQEEIQKELRFGDILRGYILAASNIEEPKLNIDFKIDIKVPDFCAVISPCCSIGHKIISLSPLIPVLSSFFDNSYFREDLTRINQEMLPEQSVASQVWESLSPEERERRLRAGKTLALVEFFIYKEDELFPEYTVHRRDEEDFKTRYYMIDFRNIYRLNCKKIVNPKNFPLESKCLQLTIGTRSELRYKIANYYSRVPKEDKILED
jgi:hypothetical protein